MYIEIKTERLTLRPLGIKDLDTTFDYASNPDVTKYMLFRPAKEKSDTLLFLKRVESEWKKDNPSFYEMAIILGNRHIGAVSATLNKERDTAELGWILNKNYHNQGYMNEAATALVQYVKEHLHIHHFIAHCDSRNIPSFKVMEHLGLKKISESPRSYSDEKGNFVEYTYKLDC